MPKDTRLYVMVLFTQLTYLGHAWKIYVCAKKPCRKASSCAIR